MNQNLSAMGVASCRRTFLCLILRVRLVLSQFSVRDWSPCRACCGFRFAKRPDPTQPAPAPGAPTLPRAPSSLSLSHLDLPRNNLPLPLPPLSPRGAVGIGDGDHRNLDPEVSSPPLPSSSLSLPFPSLRATLSLPCARRSPAPLRPCARRRSPPPWPLAAAAPAPHPGPSRRRRPPPPRPPGMARPPLPPARLGPWRAPCPRCAAPGARPRPPARGVPALGVARVALAWPRASPFTPSAFPRAQPHARGDYSCFFS
jgi:hypothetical protein